MRLAISGRKYELFKIFKPYLFYKDGETCIKEEAPQKAKEAFYEYIAIPDELDEC